MKNSESLTDVLCEVSSILQITRPLTVLDVETTGTSPGHDRVVQVAFVSVAPDGGVSEFSRLINPGILIPPEATEVHGITNAQAAESPTFGHIAQSLSEALIGHDYIAYQFRFDRDVLEAEFGWVGVSSPFVDAAWIDPLRIWQHLEPRTLSDALERFYGTRPIDAHRADADVDSTARVLVGQLRKYGSTDSLGMSVSALSAISSPRHSTWIDADGKIVRRNGVACLNFGKYRGVTLQEIDPGYLKWMLTRDFAADLKAIVSEALAGRDPKAPESVGDL